MARFREEEREKEKTGTRQKLLDAAVAEFAREGFDHANINRISEAAGLGKGTVYNYFPSKKDLMLDLIAEVSGKHEAYMRSRVLAEGGPLERLKTFFSSGFEFVQEFPAQSRFLIGTMYGANAAFKEAMYERYRWMGNLVAREILDYGKLRGYFKNVEPAASAGLLMTLYLGTVAVLDENGKPYMDAEQVYHFILRAVEN